MNYYTIQQIETFFAVVEHGSISKAAKAMYVSQPSLSKTLSRLEISLEVQLFNRASSAMTLTKEGEYLYYQFKTGYNLIAQAIEKAKDSHSKQEKILHVGCYSSFDRSCEFDGVKRLITSYMEIYPDVRVVEEIMEFRELRNSLMAGELDIVFSLSFALKNMPETSVRKIQKQSFAVAMALTHPLAMERELDISKLNDETFIFISPVESQIDKSLNLERCRQAGFTPKNILYVQNGTTAMRAAINGKGLMLICQNYGNEDRIKLFPLPELPNSPYIMAAWRTYGVSRELKALIDILPSVV